MSVLSLKTCIPNLTSVALTILELLRFNPQNLGVMWPDHAHFLKNFLGSCPYCPWEIVPNLKSVAWTILELLAFNPPPKKIRGRVTLATPPFWKIFGGHVRIVFKNIYTKLEDWNFNRFEAIVCYRLTDNALYHRPRFGQELTYFTKWVELPILSFYLVYLIISVQTPFVVNLAFASACLSLSIR